MGPFPERAGKLLLEGVVDDTLCTDRTAARISLAAQLSEYLSPCLVTSELANY
jgi:hypothetical protein